MLWEVGQYWWVLYQPASQIKMAKFGKNWNDDNPHGLILPGLMPGGSSPSADWSQGPNSPLRVARSASERVGREMAAVSFKEYSLQDANTLEATQMGIEAGVIDRWPLNDQEVLVRHFHHGVSDWVESYEREPVKG